MSKLLLMCFLCILLCACHKEYDPSALGLLDPIEIPDELLPTIEQVKGRVYNFRSEALGYSEVLWTYHFEEDGKTLIISSTQWRESPVIVFEASYKEYDSNNMKRLSYEGNYVNLDTNNTEVLNTNETLITIEFSSTLNEINTINPYPYANGETSEMILSASFDLEKEPYFADKVKGRTYASKDNTIWYKFSDDGHWLDWHDGARSQIVMIYLYDETLAVFRTKDLVNWGFRLYGDTDDGDGLDDNYIARTPSPWAGAIEVPMHFATEYGAFLVPKDYD